MLLKKSGGLLGEIEMKTILELYCEFKGWQGGTIYQALADYQALPLDQKDHFCNKVFNFETKNVLDLKTFSTFLNARF